MSEALLLSALAPGRYKAGKPWTAILSETVW